MPLPSRDSDCWATVQKVAPIPTPAQPANHFTTVTPLSGLLVLLHAPPFTCPAAHLAWPALHVPVYSTPHWVLLRLPLPTPRWHSFYGQTTSGVSVWFTAAGLA